jgi:hypothetical protein
MAEVGCQADGPTGFGIGPAMPTVSAATRIVSGTSLSLEVSAIVRNPTRSHILVVNGPDCPLFVRIFPDSSAEEQVASSPTVSCAISRTPPLVDLSPGGSMQIRRVIPGDSLAAFSSGTYGVYVAVEIVNAFVGAWAGAIQLPLASSP